MPNPRPHRGSDTPVVSDCSDTIYRSSGSRQYPAIAENIFPDIHPSGLPLLADRLVIVPGSD